MKHIWNFLLLLALIANYSHGRYVAEWSITTDQSLIDECLSSALRQLSKNQDTDVSQSKIANLVCKTKLLNGLHIKLYFDLGQQRWECSFYKPPIEALDMQYDKCNQIENQNSPEQIQQQPSPLNDDDEAKIDKLSQDVNQNQQDSEQKADNNVEETDDEEDLNKDPDNANTNDGENNQQDPTQNADENNDEETLNKDSDKDDENNQQGSQENMVNDEKNSPEDNPEVPKENENGNN